MPSLLTKSGVTVWLRKWPRQSKSDPKVKSVTHIQGGSQNSHVKYSGRREGTVSPGDLAPAGGNYMDNTTPSNSLEERDNSLWPIERVHIPGTFGGETGVKATKEDPLKINE